MHTPPRGPELDAILLRQLPEVTFDVASRFRLTGDVDQIGVMEQRLDAVVHVYDHDEDGAEWLRAPGVTLREPKDQGDQMEAVIATTAALSIDLRQAGHLGELLDTHSAWAEELLLLERHGILNDVLLGSNRSAKGTRLLLVDPYSTKLAPAWRFLGGVGRLLFARALRELSADCATVAVRPTAHTDEWVGRIPDIDSADDTVRHLARSIGFNRVGDTGIWAMDPRWGSLDAAIDELERRHLGENART